MSDHDRGAYTPHNDAPLSFDARKSRGRRAFPTTLLVSLVVLIGLGVAIFMFYRSGVRGAGEAPTPVGTPVGEFKSAPSSQAQQPPQDPGQGLQIYKAEGKAEAAAGGAPVAAAPATGFAAPPEQPQARPVAPVTAQAIASAKPAPTQMAAADPTAAAPVQVAQAAPPKPVVQAPAPVVTAAKPAVAAPAKPAVAAAKPAPAKDEVGALLASSKPAPQVAAKKVEPAKPAPVAKTEVASAAHGAAVVQFGAFSSSDLASSEWAKLAKAYPSEMSGKGRLVESVERDGKTLFRGAVSGFASKADAVAFCAKLKADSKACIVK